MEQLEPKVGEKVCVEHRSGASLAEIIEATANKFRLRYVGWMPHDIGNPEFDIAPESLRSSSANASVPWCTFRDRVVFPSSELLGMIIKKK